MPTGLFQHIEELQGERPWGRLLDAGTGWASFRWALSLPAEEVVAVTGSLDRKQKMEHDFATQPSERHRLLHGNWVDEALLEGQKFDTVLVDYLLGAVDRFAPYFQTRLFGRLKKLVEGRMYVVGLEPYPEPKGSTDGLLLQELCALRDSTLLLSGDRPNREFPRWWVVEQLQINGFRVDSQASFPIRYGEEFVKAELDLCRDRFHRLPAGLQTCFRKTEANLRDKLLKRVKQKPMEWGSDYVVAAEPAQL